jgi:hypothetical protein
VNEVACPLQYVFYHKAAHSREQYMCIKLCFKLGTSAEKPVSKSLLSETKHRKVLQHMTGLQNSEVE